MGGAILVAGLTAAACGSPTRTPTATATHTVAPTATPTPVGPALVVWSTKAGAAQVIRTLPASGGAAHTIATIPGSAQVVGAGGGKLVYIANALSLHVVSLATGADTGFATGAVSTSSAVFGGAVSPDGTRVAYVVAAPAGGAQLRVLALAAGTSMVLHAYTSGPVDAPVEWTATRIVATSIVPFSDAGPQAAVALDPSTGAETNSSSIAGSGGPTFSADGMTAANAVHTSGLGDDGDSPGGPGPAMPFNTLRVFSVGATPAIVYQKVHHNITVLAVSADGTHVLFFNDSSAGGFAGISMSPDFGLFAYAGGASPTQFEPLDGPRWDAAAYVDTSTAFVARHVGAAEQLTIVGPGHASPFVVDSVSGGDQPVFVGYSPIS